MYVCISAQILTTVFNFFTCFFLPADPFILCRHACMQAYTRVKTHTHTHTHTHTRMHTHTHRVHAFALISAFLVFSLSSVQFLNFCSNIDTYKCLEEDLR